MDSPILPGDSDFRDVPDRAALALVWLLPPAINKAAGRFGLECHYDKLDMSLLGGDFGIWHVKVTPIGSDKALAAADYCRLDVSTLALLRGEIHVNRLEADGADVDIERDADGSIPLLVRFSGAVPRRDRQPPRRRASQRHGVLICAAAGDRQYSRFPCAGAFDRQGRDAGGVGGLEPGFLAR